MNHTCVNMEYGSSSRETFCEQILEQFGILRQWATYLLKKGLVGLCLWGPPCKVYMAGIEGEGLDVESREGGKDLVDKAGVLP